YPAGGASGVILRLNSKEEFAQALKTPVVARTVHFVLHAPRSQARAAEPMAPTAPDRHRIGCVLPKRWARRAVTRNLLRRLIMSLARQCLLQASTGDYVIRLRAGFDKQAFPSASSEALKGAMRDELQNLFAQLAKTHTTSKPSVASA
ncbi:MAG: hypothetical protein RLZZ271_1047, partial [Pseudomonadota bacterium]